MKSIYLPLHVSYSTYHDSRENVGKRQAKIAAGIASSESSSRQAKRMNLGNNYVG